jgi:hypothetical protein
MAAKFTARDVLDELDDAASPRRAAFFPDLDHPYNYHVDQRLTAYASADRWAIVIEQLAVNPRSWGVGGIHTNLYYHGTGVVLPPQPGWKTVAVQSLFVVEDGPGGPLCAGDSVQDINPAATEVRIRGQVVPIRTDSNYYWARNIDVETLTHAQIDEWIASARRVLDPKLAEQKVEEYEAMRSRVGAFELNTWHLVRGLVPEHRDLLLAIEDERRLGVPADLTRVLQINEWDHPRLMEGELPRSSEAFKQIAKVLASGDASLYRPTEPPNTHWSNWPRSGSL